MLLAFPGVFELQEREESGECAGKWELCLVLTRAAVPNLFYTFGFLLRLHM